MGGKKQTRSCTRSGSSSAADAHTDALADALADISVHPQPTATSSAPATSSAAPSRNKPAPRKAAGAAPLRPTTVRDGQCLPREPTSPEHQAEFQQALKLHDRTGMGYLAAFVQVSPDLLADACSGEAEEAFTAAANRFTSAAHHYAATVSIDTALVITQAALREAMVQYGAEHDATLICTFEYANMLGHAGHLDAAYKKWKWLIPRSPVLPFDEWVSGFHTRMQATNCLMTLHRFAECIPYAREMYNIRRRSHGEGDTRALDALDTVCFCAHMADYPEPATLIPFLQLHVEHLRRRAQGDGGDEGVVSTLYRDLNGLHTCQRALGDNMAAVETSREILALARRVFGVTDPGRVISPLRVHTQDLAATNQHGKAVSLLTQALQQSTSTYGESHKQTIRIATILGHSFLAAKRYQVAIGVFAKAWQAAAGGMFGDAPVGIPSMEDDTEDGMQLLGGYIEAFLGSGDQAGAKKVSAEARKRGWEKMYVDGLWHYARDRIAVREGSGGGGGGAASSAAETPPAAEQSLVVGRR